MPGAETTLEYHDGATRCEGYYIAPEDADGPLPLLLVCPAWDGLVDEIRDKARRLADAGYIAFVVDVHGEGKAWDDFSQLQAALAPFMNDRAMLLRRLQAAVTAAHGIPGADLGRIGAIGYCFGGTCVLDLARAAGSEVRAAVSLHGGLAPNGLDSAGVITAHVLVLHGHDDPLVPPEQVSAFQQEMTDRQADWQLVAYGHTVHAFTRPAANNPDFGTMYNAVADRRSWQAMLQFLSEVL